MRPLGGWLADRVGGKRILLAAFALFCLAVLLLFGRRAPRQAALAT